MLGLGISDFFAKNVIEKIGSTKTLFYTQIVGIFFLLLFFLKDRVLPVFDLRNVLLLIVCSLLSTIGYFFLYKSFELGKISIVSPITSSYVILASIISYIFFKEFFSSNKIFILLVIVVGIVLIALDPKIFTKRISKNELMKGVPQALITLIAYGILVPIWDNFLESPGWLVWIILSRIILAFTIYLFSIIRDKKFVVSKDLFKVKQFLYLLLFISFFEAIGSLGSAWGYHASSNTTSLVTAIVSTYSLTTAVLAYFFLKERLGKTQYIGIILIIIGLCLSPFI